MRASDTVLILVYKIGNPQSLAYPGNGSGTRFAILSSAGPAIAPLQSNVLIIAAILKQVRDMARRDRFRFRIQRQ